MLGTNECNFFAILKSQQCTNVSYFIPKTHGELSAENSMISNVSMCTDFSETNVFNHFLNAILTLTILRGTLQMSRHNHKSTPRLKLKTVPNAEVPKANETENCTQC